MVADGATAMFEDLFVNFFIFVSLFVDLFIDFTVEGVFTVGIAQESLGTPRDLSCSQRCVRRLGACCCDHLLFVRENVNLAIFEAF